jgi:hypothetical protein
VTLAAASSLVIAHAGHWLVDLLYLLPLVIVAIALHVSWVRGRRADAARDETHANDLKPDGS